MSDSGNNGNNGFTVPPLTSKNLTFIKKNPLPNPDILKHDKENSLGAYEGEEFSRVYAPKLVEGAEFHAISLPWFDQWCIFSAFDIRTVSVKPQGGNGIRPPPIDNSKLLDEQNIGALSKSNAENRDIIYINQAAASLLYEWYGGGPVIVRKVITVGLKKEPQLELYPIFISHFIADQNGNPSLSHPDNKYGVPHSSKSNFESILNEYSGANKKGNDDIGAPGGSAAAASEPSVVPCRIWIPTNFLDENNKKIERVEEWKVLTDDDLRAPLESFNIRECHPFPILIEFQQNGQWSRIVAEHDLYDFRSGDIIQVSDSDSKWFECTVRLVRDEEIFVRINGHATSNDIKVPRSDKSRFAKRGTNPLFNGSFATNSSSLAFRGSTYNGAFNSNWSDNNGKTEHGAVGLQNLGNTCFMNSILASLAHTPVLANYFLDGNYLKDLNRNNPIGWQGKMADAFGNWITEFWSGKYSSIAPRNLKNAIGEFQPTFIGYQQQDANELLLFLLDGLHEDLNRVKTKPATPAVESNGRPDEIVAKEAWETHLKRNQSVILDYFSGQIKSKLICPESTCKNISITFDPYNVLTLPLPQDPNEKIKVRFYTTATVYGLIVHKKGLVRDLLEALSVLCQVSARRLVLCGMGASSIDVIYESDTPLTSVVSRDALFAYEVPSLEQYPDGICVKVFNKTEEKDFGGRPSLKNNGNPFLVALPRTPFPPSLLKSIIYDTAAIYPTYFKNKPVKDDNAMDGVTAEKDENPHSPALRGGKSDDESPLKQEESGEDDAVIVSHKDGNSEGGDSKGKNPVKDIVAPFSILATKSSGMRCFYECNGTCNGDGCPLKDGDFQVPLVKDHYYNYHIKDDKLQSDVSFNIVWESGKHGTFAVQRKFDPSTEFPGEKPYTANLKDCFSLYTVEEILDKDDMWYCPKCKQHRCASKTLSLWKLPPILVVNLNRFKDNRRGWREKITTMVDFPVEGLDMSEYTTNPIYKDHNAASVYDLYAISNHYGSIAGGHYTAYIKNLANGQWYDHDDSSVRRIDVSEVRTRNAYLLFYKRRDINTESK